MMDLPLFIFHEGTFNLPSAFGAIPVLNMMNMQFLSNFRFCKASLLIGFFAVFGGYSIHEATGNAFGVVGKSKAGCGGYGCHSPSAQTSTTITISTQATQILPGQTYLFTISVKNSNGIQQAAGCDISVDNSAKLAINGNSSGLQYYGYGNELTHTSPSTFGTTDSAVWTFKYIAPLKGGTAHIYGAGNAVNLNGHADNGDLWNKTVYALTVFGPAISVPSTFRDTTLTGFSHASTVWVKNTGAATLTINRFALKSGVPFQIIDSSTHSIAAGDSAAVKIQFTTNIKGQIKDTLQYFNNDASSPVVTTILVGVGTSGSGVGSSMSVESEFQVLGNPSAGLLRIRSTVSGPMDVRIADMSGRIALHEELESQPEFMLDLTNLPSGAYFLRIQPRVGEAFVRRIVIQH
jgi:hypothetical protein